MDYNHITSFLDKFKKIIFEKEEINETISSVVSKNINFKINTSLIKIRHNIIYIEASPMIHSEILIKKQLILKDLAVLLPDKKFLDIK